MKSKYKKSWQDVQACRLIKDGISKRMDTDE